MNDYMKKGAVGVILIIFGILIIVEVFILSTFLNKTIAIMRHSWEANIVFERITMETYIRSFQAAAQLSLLQAIADTGEHTNDIWQYYSSNVCTDCGSKFPSETFLKNSIITSTTNHLKEYMAEYRKEIPTYTPTNSEIIVKSLNFGDNEINIEFDKMLMKSVMPDIVQKMSFNIKKEYVLTAKLDTIFRQLIARGQSFISTDKVGNLVLNTINEYLRTSGDPPTTYASRKYCSSEGEPSDEELYGKNFETTESEIENRIIQKINDYTEVGDYRFSLTTKQVDVQIVPSCSQPIEIGCCKWSTCVSCSEYCTVDEEGNEQCYTVCSSYDCPPCLDLYYEKSCFFRHYGAAKVLVNVQENPSYYPTYPIYVNNLNKVENKNINLEFIVISGNGEVIKETVQPTPPVEPIPVYEKTLPPDKDSWTERTKDKYKILRFDLGENLEDSTDHADGDTQYSVKAYMFSLPNTLTLELAQVGNLSLDVVEEGYKKVFFSFKVEEKPELLGARPATDIVVFFIAKSDTRECIAAGYEYDGESLDDWRTMSIDIGPGSTGWQRGTKPCDDSIWNNIKEINWEVRTKFGPSAKIYFYLDKLYFSA